MVPGVCVHMLHVCKVFVRVQVCTDTRVLSKLTNEFAKNKLNTQLNHLCSMFSQNC